MKFSVAVASLNSYRRNIAALLAGQAIAYLVPLISVPFLARVLGLGPYGRLAFAIACVQYFQIVTDYGFNLSATRRLAIIKHDSEQVAQLLASVTVIKLLLCAAGFVVVVALATFVPELNDSSALLACAYIAVLGHSIFPLWFFLGLERMQAQTVCIFIGQLISLASLVLFVNGPNDLSVAAASLGLAPVISAICGWLVLRSAGLARWSWAGRNHALETLRDGWHTFYANAAIGVYTTTTIVGLGFISTAEAVGLFSAADKIVKAVLGLTSPVAQAVYPHIARLSAQSRESALAFIGRLLRWQCIGNGVLSFALLIGADTIVRTLFGAQFAAAADVIRWMALLPLIVGASNVLGVQAMLNFGMSSAFARIVASSCLFHVIVLLPLVDRFGASGAGTAILATEVFVVILMSRALSKGGLLAPIVRAPHP
ncbi:flippase [Caenimonas koreensis]|uniref:flippase n=1 Tax=Caenimonas koreensis TaxID=367474 RepID=UPI00188DD4B9|nr:flippase [Caenimonas koreensis]